MLFQDSPKSLGLFIGFQKIPYRNDYIRRLWPINHYPWHKHTHTQPHTHTSPHPHTQTPTHTHTDTHTHTQTACILLFRTHAWHQLIFWRLLFKRGVHSCLLVIFCDSKCLSKWPQTIWAQNQHSVLNVRLLTSATTSHRPGNSAFGLGIQAQ